MISGLPWTTWLLLVAGVGIGLVVEVYFVLAHRVSRSSRRPSNQLSPPR